MDAVVSRWGRVDCFVTAAGACAPRLYMLIPLTFCAMNLGIVDNIPALEYPVDRIRRLYDTNVHGSYFCAREAAKRMINTKTNDSVILMASMSGRIVNVPQPQTPYNASKASKSTSSHWSGKARKTSAEVRHMAASKAVE